MLRRTFLWSSSLFGLMSSPAEAILFSGAPAATSSAVNIPLTLINIAPSTSFVTPMFSYAQPFKDGDVPAGGSVTAKDSFGNPCTVQFDAVSNWPSGSPKLAVITGVTSETFSGTAQKSYTITTTATAPNNTPAAGWSASGTAEATMAANSDIKVVFSSFDAGASTYTVSLNSIFSNYTNYPWGTSSPVGGWRRTKSGPVCMEWFAWQYLINDGSSVAQGYARLEMRVKAQSPTGPFDVRLRLVLPNMWNTVTTGAEQHNNDMPRWASLMVLKNGASVIANLGGASDPRTAIIPNASFNTTTHQITQTPLQYCPETACIFASTGTLPTGLTANTLYWIANIDGISGNAYIMTSLVMLSRIESKSYLPTWAANTAYTASTDLLGTTVVINNGTVYYCTVSGTSASSGGPTGTGTITDGTVTWVSCSIPFSSQGTGTISVSPVYAAYPNAGVDLADVNGDPFWIGSGTYPMIVPGHDFAYLTASKATPPFNSAAGFSTDSRTQPTFFPNALGECLLWYQDTTGDGAGDQRVGYIDQYGVSALFNPSDPYQYRGSLYNALGYSQQLNSYIYDETGGMPFVGNNGPSKNGTAYTNFPNLIPSWGSSSDAGFFSVAGNAGLRAHTRGANWGQWSTAVKDHNGHGGQSYLDSSHTPFPCFIPYLKTGDPMFLEQGINIANASVFTPYLNSATLSNGTTHTYCVANAQIAGMQLRGLAWSLRSLMQGYYITPDAHPFKPVLADMYSDNFLLPADYYTNTMPTAGKTFAMTIAANFGGSPQATSNFSTAFYDGVVCMEKWRGGQVSGSLTNITTLFNYLRNYWNLYTADPNGLYYAGAYGTTTGVTPYDFTTSYTTASQVWTTSYTSGYNANMVAPYPASGLFSAAQSPPNLMTLNNYYNAIEYQTIGRAVLKLRSIVDPTDSTIVALVASWSSKIAAATGVSSATGGVNWTGANSNFQLNAIF